MAIRKLTTIHHLEELDLRPQTLTALKKTGITVEELITVTRAYTVWEDIEQLTQFPRIGEIRAEEITQAIDEAGFILHESKRSHCARKLLVAVLGSSDVLLEHYEDLEDMAPEALEAVYRLVHESLSDRDSRILELCFGLKDGQPLSLENCARKFDTTKERIRQQELRALVKLRHSSCCSRLEVAVYYSREALSRRTAILCSEIDKLQAELDTLRSGNPYSEPETVEAASVPIERLGSSVRIYNCLKQADVHTIGELCSYTENDLLRIRNLGVRNVEEIKDLLKGMGLSLAS